MSRGRMMIVLVLMLMAAISPVRGGAFDGDFEKGNTFYSTGDYANAITAYQGILNAGYHSSELYYNLGDACFRTGQLGRAILYYTRAKQLDPRDEDIQANLAFARRFAIDKIEITEETILLEYVNRFFDTFSLNEITWMAALLYLLTAAAILAHYIYRWFYLPKPVIVLLVSLFVLTAVFAGVKLDRDVLTRSGVVLDQQTEVKNGPGDDFTNQFTAHAGLMFTIEREESGYYLVDFENRLKGWIVKSAVAEI
ncbi:MAG: tetratricopeptide repeat protein [candidate division Zixibacteria bacterium]|nr:tetratricopeptide repeat protein [candidate division Zixibacteria bacterium]